MSGLMLRCGKSCISVLRAPVPSLTPMIRVAGLVSLLSCATFGTSDRFKTRYPKGGGSTNGRTRLIPTRHGRDGDGAFHRQRRRMRLSDGKGPRVVRSRWECFAQTNLCSNGRSNKQSGAPPRPAPCANRGHDARNMSDRLLRRCLTEARCGSRRQGGINAAGT